MFEYLLVLTTVPVEKTAEKIATNLVDNRLAACVTRTTACLSTYWWQGQIERDEEYIVFRKTQIGCYPELETKLVAIHPYEVPEVIALPLVNGYEGYLKWLKEETVPDQEEGS